MGCIKSRDKERTTIAHLFARAFQKMIQALSKCKVRFWKCSTTLACGMASASSLRRGSSFRDEDVLQITSRLGSCGVWLTVQRGVECVVGCGDARISDAGHVFKVAIKRRAGGGESRESVRVPDAAVNRGHRLTQCCCTSQESHRLRHAIGMKMGLRRIEEGFGAPTRGLPLARFLAEGVSLISYSWLGGHHTPQTPAFSAHSQAAQHCPQL